MDKRATDKTADKTDKLIKFITEHKKLGNFVLRLYNISQMLASEEFRYIYLVSLISSDNLVDVESCEESISQLTELLEWSEVVTDDPKIRKEVVKYAKKGLHIAKRDLKLFKAKTLDNK